MTAASTNAATAQYQALPETAAASVAGNGGTPEISVARGLRLLGLAGHCRGGALAGLLLDLSVPFLGWYIRDRGFGDDSVGGLVFADLQSDFAEAARLLKFGAQNIGSLIAATGD